MSPVSPTSSSPESLLGPDLEPGQKVGEYEVDAKIGQGGFGAVWKATHPLIGKVVAIKVLARRFSVDPEMVSRFVAEARAVNQICHRHIVDIFSFGYLDDGRAYYVMEYLDGETLDVRIERESMSLADAIPILRGIARALDAAHAKGIAHRDLKAENVLVSRDDDGAPFPKLLDFGIAKLLAPEDGTSHKTRTGAPIGTPYYMSPEQCRGRDVDHRTDFYAFGVLAYLMLTGVFPLDGDDYMSILMAQMTRQPDPASSRVPLPDGVDDVIAWLMQKEAANRPPSLAAAMTAFEAAAAKAGIAVATPTSMIPVPMTTPSRITPVGLATTSPPPKAALLAAVAPSRPAARSSRRGMWIAISIVAASAIIAIAIIVISSERTEPPAQQLAATHDRHRDDAVVTPTADPPPQTAGSASDMVPQRVVITIDATPDRVEAVVAGRVIGTAPGPLEVDRSDHPIDIVFRHAGFVPHKHTIVPDRDQKLAVHLERPVPRVVPPAKPDPHSTENPFP